MPPVTTLANPFFFFFFGEDVADGDLNKFSIYLEGQIPSKTSVFLLGFWLMEELTVDHLLVYSNGDLTLMLFNEDIID